MVARPRRKPTSTDFRKRPELYRVGRGEQGVFQVEPYKSEILPLWRFRTPALARVSSAAILRRFHAYGRKRDFVGMDMARKFLQMGKAQSARIFYAAWRAAAADPLYQKLAQEHRLMRSSSRS